MKMNKKQYYTAPSMTVMTVVATASMLVNSITKEISSPADDNESQIETAVWDE